MFIFSISLPCRRPALWCRYYPSHTAPPASAVPFGSNNMAKATLTNRFHSFSSNHSWEKWEKLCVMGLIPTQQQTWLRCEVRQSLQSMLDLNNPSDAFLFITIWYRTLLNYLRGLRNDALWKYHIKAVDSFQCERSTTCCSFTITALN